MHSCISKRGRVRPSVGQFLCPLVSPSVHQSVTLRSVFDDVTNGGIQIHIGPTVFRPDKLSPCFKTAMVRTCFKTTYTKLAIVPSYHRLFLRLFRFLDAFSHLYKRCVRPLVGPSVRRFVGPLVRQSIGWSVCHTRDEFRGNGLDLNKIAPGTWNYAV